MMFLLFLLSASMVFASQAKYEIHRNISSRFVDPRWVVVYLPPDYYQNTHCYPVLYMHDGQNLFDSKKTGLRGTGSPVKWDVDRVLEELVARQEASPCIIVGIFNTSKRIEEYSPPTNSQERGLLGKYAQFIVEELKPWIDNSYRTDPSPAATGVMGSSMGGLASFYLQMWYPHVFGFAGVVSPSFWWGNQRVLKDIEQATTFSAISRLYIDAGWRESDEMMLPARSVYKKIFPLLKERLWYYEDRNGTHSEASWQNRVFLPLLLFVGKKTPSLISWSVLLEPPTLGIGDKSSFSIEVQYTENIKQTFLPSVASQDFLVSENTITATKSGTFPVTISSAVGTLTSNIVVKPKSRDDITIRFVSMRPLILEVYRYVTSNTVVATNFSLSMISTNEISVTQKRGTRFHFRLLHENHQPIQKNGKDIDLSITFTRDRDYVVEF